jgi:hypothetical protein
VTTLWHIVISQLLPNSTYIDFSLSAIPLLSVYIILTQLALVAPQALISRQTLIALIVFVIFATISTSIFAGVQIPLPSVTLAEGVDVAPVVTGVGLAIALQMLLIPGTIGGILTGYRSAQKKQSKLVRADFTDASIHDHPTLSQNPTEAGTKTSSKQNTDSDRFPGLLREIAKPYAPQSWTLAIPFLWLLTLNIAVPFTAARLGLSSLLIPVAAALGTASGPGSIIAILYGGLPLLVGATAGLIEPEPSAGLFVAIILVHRLFADVTFRTRCFFADTISFRELCVLTILLGISCQIPFAGKSVQGTLGGSLLISLYCVLYLIGASQVSLRKVVLAIAASGYSGFVLNLVQPLQVYGISFHYEFSSFRAFELFQRESWFFGLDGVFSISSFPSFSGQPATTQPKGFG